MFSLRSNVDAFRTLFGAGLFFALVSLLGAPGAARRLSRRRPRSHGDHYTLLRPLETNRRRRGHIRGRPLPRAVRDDALKAMAAFEAAGFLRSTKPDRTRTGKARSGNAQAPPRSGGNAATPPRQAAGASQKTEKGGRPSSAPARARRPRKRPLYMPRNVRQPKPPSDLPSWMANLKLPSISIRWNKKLIDYLIFYHDTARGKAILRSWFRKKGRFEKMIARTLKRHRLPQFLVYVAMIESGFRPDCRSYAGAAGLWQFMPFGGRIYDLAYNYWIDERRNPERATRAAALYLRDLYVRFGSWHLALAAYNAGYGAVLRSVRRFNTNDYWKLCQLESGLPYATTNYVPKVLAVAIAGKNPAVFGLQNVKKDHPWQYDVVTVRRPVRLRRIAKAAGVKAAAIEHLNPELRRHRVPPGYKSFQIRIPAGTKKTYLARAPKLRLLPRRHTLYEVRFGEDLSTIAARFNTSRATLRKLNGIRSTTEVLPGLQILVPPGKRKSASHAARGGSTAEGSAGDSDKTIVAIPARPPSAPPGWKRVFYKVTAADTLARLTRAFGVKKRQLLRWNNLSAHAKLHSGIILQVYANPKKDLSRIRLLAKHKLEVVIVDSPAFRVAHLKNRGLKRIVYKARKRDTIRKLSRRFGLSMGSIARLNNISRFSKLKPGQKLVIYVKAKKKRSQKRGQKRKNRK